MRNYPNLAFKSVSNEINEALPLCGMIVNIKGTKKGQERFQAVKQYLFDLIPSWVKVFFPESKIEEMLQNQFDKIKDFLDDGIINNSIGDDEQ